MRKALICLLMFEEKRILTAIEDVLSDISQLKNQMVEEDNIFRSSKSNVPTDMPADFWYPITERCHSKNLSSLNKAIEDKQKELMALQEDLSSIRNKMKR